MHIYIYMCVYTYVYTYMNIDRYRYRYGGTLEDNRVPSIVALSGGQIRSPARTMASRCDGQFSTAT